MTAVELQHAIESLPATEQDRLAAFLTGLRMKREGRLAEISRRLNDTDSRNWVPWSAAKAELSQLPDGAGP